jgi:hypothetical protein
MRNIRDDRTTYHHSEKVVSEAIFANVVSPRLTVLVEGDLKRQRHSIQQFIKNWGHGGVLRLTEPENPNWPARWTSLLDAPK